MRNLDYQNTQIHFNLGLDFRIVTPTSKDIQVYSLSIPIKKDFEGLNAKESIFTLAANAKAIAKGIITNKEIYTLIPKMQSRSCISSYQDYENLARIYPYNIDKAAMQTKLGLDDMDFGMEFISDMENKQTIALYACTGKFSIFIFLLVFT